MMMKRIKAIEFRILSPEQIRKMSAIEIKSPETYDKDGFPMEGGFMDNHLGVINPGLRCKTCGNTMKRCPGHFGHIELVRPVAHSEFGKRLETLMQATCQACGRIAIPDDKLEQLRVYIGDDTIDIPKKILARTKKAKKCPHCSLAERKLVLLDKPTNFYIDKDRIYPTQIREWMEKVPDNDLEFFGYEKGKLRPEWFVLTVLQVPPINLRPSITLDSGIKSEDDLTHKLVDIIRINMRLKDNIDAGAPQLIIEDLWDLLQYHVTTYFNNNTAGVPPAKHRSGRALRTLVQRLQGKKGRFRYNLTGKRVNFAARSIITPDPLISINELGVPREIAENMTVPEMVTSNSVEEGKALVKDGKAIYVMRADGIRKKVTDQNVEELIKEIDVGYKIERKLHNGDIVLFNRQPSLHRLSMMAHRARIMDGKTFRLNPICCKPYNADFDGDEMNMHVPQTPEGIAEASELMLVEKQIISPRYGAPVIIFDEDGVSGCFILTMKQTKFSKDRAFRFFQMMGLDEAPKPDAGKDMYSGKLIFSQLLPKDLNMEYKTRFYNHVKNLDPNHPALKEPYENDLIVKIENGILKSGVIDSMSLGEGKGKLVDAIARDYPPHVLTNFYDKISRIVTSLISEVGMTVSLEEYGASHKTVKVREKAVEEMRAHAQEIVKKFHKGNLEILPGRTYKESFEIQMMRTAAAAKEKVQKQIMKETVESVMTETPKFHSNIMILSGSRGSVLNLTNLSGMWGQASVREGRPKRGFRNRLIGLNRRGDVGIDAGGFIYHNFMEGMGPKEYFYHTMGGRQGEVDTGVSTKVSGYLYRRLANSLKDLVVNNDGTVRTANKNIVQYKYGEDGVFPQKTFKGRSISVKRELEKLKSGK
ncbi:MAG: DNA-directed RNA polymerase subunit A' [Candidatus Diapherotrites archaeon]|uniref:DNA-directed RNA polymerase subunit n=1 Tax=Candidatus Iainarchaeum sp. TaxID=3101447 RepID=A0A8T3YNG4_9ARCH|nr:DNA-directed RNA polymerase subunit A' [Candidatus Diapherotrites archaeon]